MESIIKKKLNFKRGIFSLIGLFITITIFFTVFSGEENNALLNDFTQQYRIVSPPIPDELYFCGERVPLDNIDVRERLEREVIVQTYWHSSTILYLKRAYRWFPLLKKILDENKTPADMMYLSVAESGLENVVSPAGATGFWQFMKSAAKKHGLEISKEIDERYNVEKATVAACDYLKEAYEKYGSWTTAAASYNAGTNGISNQIERQKNNSYYNLILNDETSRYIFRILALKIVMNDPEKYGFDIDESELYPELETKNIYIRSGIAHFADFAKMYGINYRILKLFNPWLRQNYLTNKKKREYKILVPTEETIELFGDSN